MEKTSFVIKECDGTLSRDQLNTLLARLPISFEVVGADYSPLAMCPSGENKSNEMEVYHRAGVVSLKPAEGKRLWNAAVTDSDFPFRPDNIMDDNIGLRCCYHPKLASFGLPAKDKHGYDSIEVDIYKYPSNNRHGIKST